MFYFNRGNVFLLFGITFFPDWIPYLLLTFLFSSLNNVYMVAVLIILILFVPNIVSCSSVLDYEIVSGFA